MSKTVMDELAENKAVQAGGTAVLASTTSLCTGALGITAAGKAGVIIAAVGGPVGWLVGGALLIGGAAYTLSNRKK